MADSDTRRRSRPVVSCVLCRRRKIRCNREMPCSNCRRSKNNRCVYVGKAPAPLSPPDSGITTTTTATTATAGDTAARPILPAPAQASSTASSSGKVGNDVSSCVMSSTEVTTPSSHSSVPDSEYLQLKLRVQQLERELEGTSLGFTHSSSPMPALNISTTNSRISGTLHVLHEAESSGRTESIVRGVVHKTRLFGQSHWGVHGVPLICKAFETIARRLRTTYRDVEGWTDLDKCKSLSREIKALRTPAWPCLVTCQLPSREIADALVGCYLQTVESVYRILHVPSFHRDYNALWACTDVTTSAAAPCLSVLVQVKLVLALGAVTYDANFSLRPFAIRWVYEALTWVSEPKFKARLDVKFLQTLLLLAFAQDRVGVSGDSMWISAGALVRRSMLMGLHRDPSRLGSSKKTFFAAEMHRRLWNTIVEVAIQSSLNSGGPPLFSMKDFDTGPPGNYTDEQLLMESEPLPKPVGTFTPMSVALVLRSTLPQRLAVVEFLNGLSGAGTYEETLRLDKELRSAYKAQSRILRAQDTPAVASPAYSAASSRFELYSVDLLMNLYLLSLHVPYFGPSLHETAFAFSRKVVVELALRLWRSTCPTTLPPLDFPGNHNASSAATNVDLLLPRLALCSSGLYPKSATHAAFLIAIDVRAQMQEQEAMGSIVRSPDTFPVLEEAKAWCLRNIEAGETNVKGYLLINVVAAQIQALSLGRWDGGDNDDDTATADLLVGALRHVEKTCLPMLEAMAAGAKTWRPESMRQVTLGGPGDIMADWDLMATNIPSILDSAESMSWMFNDDLDMLLPSI